ncbi:peptidylprolyl isomerase [Magnetospirillum sulfuroxidans]|uniref:Peptidyl-prolyl cis-trans isomerase n=1 Tax=Magnetospirillum sulfuroxidans TaxID=611300 RepID=A0ABS5I9L2_9PROT|nr:peptidylprolyl isomerase [Magnetospirillum sulfuroxidans]MBR9970433.1 peptidylprolyl isomerase [Magnetospirillum sulfuroxidans]
MLKKIVLAVAVLLVATLRPALAADPENTLILDLPWGQVVIEMRPDLAPKHVERIKELTRKGFYNGTVFHRVIDGFMAQGGDPTGTGTGGSGVKLPAEFSGEHFVRGVVGMARASSPNSADSQFFIMLASAPSLDGKYTIWGNVIQGMESVDKITKGTDSSGAVANPDKLVRLRVAADVK